MAVYDSFDGPSLDVDKWAIYMFDGNNGAVVVDGKVNLNFTTSATAQNVAIRTKEPTFQTGTIVIEVDWTPGDVYQSAYARPYIALIPISPTRQITYGYPNSVPIVRLGIQNNTTTRTVLAIGTADPTNMNVTGTNNSVTGTWASGTTYALRWTVNWDTMKMALAVDGVTLISNVSFSYTPPGTLYVELGNCGYGGSPAKSEKFDNIEYPHGVVPTLVLMGDDISTTTAFSQLAIFNAFDVILAADSQLALATSQMVDRLKASETVTPTATIRALMNDQLAPADALAAIVLALHSDNVTMTDTSSGSLELIALMAELLACASRSTATVEIAASLMDLLAAREALSYIQSATMDDTLTLADNLTAAINALAYSSDFIALTEQFQNGLIVLTGDTLAASDLTTANMNVLMAWQDAIACFTNLPLDDGNYTAWVMNAETTGMSRYTVPSLNSLFDHDGRVWGVSATGLWELAGDTDDGDPIDAWVKTGHFDFGTGHRKNLPRAYLYVKTTGEMALRVTSSDRGTRTERTYPIHTHPAGDDEAGRIVKLARGLKGVYWQVEIANTDGCDFEIEGCEVYPVTLSRRGQ